MGAAGRELTQERYSWDAIAQHLVEIYTSVIGSVTAVAASP
jgi:glycosyltransferase involved in cell wall biosynthesis